MSVRGIDIAWARPDIAGIKATGAKWVARYFSGDASKNLTKQEVLDYSAALLGTVTVFETTAGRALQGRAAGAADAANALGQQRAVGIPNTYAIHFAVDTDTDWASVEPYFAGVCSVMNKALVGVYGGYKIAQGAHAYGLHYIWQADAWSNGLLSPAATIYQHGGTVLNGGADLDDAKVPDFGQYPHPNQEDIVTPQDKQDIADLVYAKFTSGTGREELAYAVTWYIAQMTASPDAPPWATPEMKSLWTEFYNLAHKDTNELKAAIAALPKT
jgi:hypothetical protein